MSAKRVQKPLTELSSNLLLPAKKQKKAAPNIELTIQPSETFVPVNHSALDHAKARVPQDIELTPIAFFNLFWGDSILDQIVQATNAYARARKWRPLTVAGSISVA